MDFTGIKERVSLVDYCNANLEPRHGGFYVCPVCNSGNGPNKTAAFKVDPSKGSWYCFSCGQGGDIFDLAGIIEGTEDKKEQAEAVARFFGIGTGTGKTAGKRGAESRSNGTKKQAGANTPDYSAGRAKERAFIEECRAALDEPDAVGYLERRGISLEEARRAGIGYDRAARRIVIPWKGTDWYHIDRAIDHDGSGKYHKPKSADVGRQPLWNRAALNGPAPHFVVEGALDALAIELCGYEAVALGGTGYLDYLEAVKAARAASTPILALDNDEAGRAAQERLAAAMDEAGIGYGTLEYGTINEKDAAGALAGLRDHLERLLADEAEKADLEAEKRREAARLEAMRTLRILDPADVAGDILVLRHPLEKVETGLRSLDAALDGGLPSRGLVILGAISSTGKTTLAVNLADNLARSGRPVLFVTIEQSAEEIVAKSLSRILSAGARANGAALAASSQAILSADTRNGWSERDKDKEAALLKACEEYAAEIAPRLRIIEAEAQPAVADIRTAAALMAEGGAAPIVFVDYLQLLAPEDVRDTDKQAVDRNVMALRQAARDLDTCIFAVSSLNRASYAEGVTLEAFKESGAIEYGADVLLGLQPAGMADKVAQTSPDRQRKEARAFVANHKAEDRREVEVIVLKNRNGGLPGKPATLDYDALTNTFSG